MVAEVGVILTGGTAGALRPLTDFLPKCMLPLGNKTIIERLLRSLDNAGFNEIIVAGGRLGEIIEAHLDLLKKANIINTIIKYINVGTAISSSGDALLQIKPLLNRRFMFVVGDVLIENIDFKQLYEYHADLVNSKKAIGSLVVSEKHHINVGVAFRSKSDGILSKFLEKPNSGIYCANTGYAIFEPEIFSYINSGDNIFGNSIPKAIESGETIGSFEIDRWYHIQTLADLHKEHIGSYSKWIKQ
jgi:mannose-1-phosphate guanylyltransferase